MKGTPRVARFRRMNLKPERQQVVASHGYEQAHGNGDFARHLAMVVGFNVAANASAAVADFVQDSGTLDHRAFTWVSLASNAPESGISVVNVRKFLRYALQA